MNLRGRRALVIGGDARAGGRVTELLADGADVTVAAPELTATLADLVDRGLVSWVARDATLDDVLAADVVVTARTAAPDDERILGTGLVTLVGGGPGDPGLITVAGREALERADVVVTDRLAPVSALAWARADAEIVDVAKVPGGRTTPQEEINRLLVEHAKAGRRVVRLKGGDGFVFGRGGEELIACTDAGLEVHVVPGVTSAVAAPAVAGIPVTHRGLSQGFTVISGHVPPADPTSTIDYAALARSGTTLVVLMGVRTLPAICEALVAGGLDPDTPAAIVADASLPSQHVVRGTVSTIADAPGIRPPAVVVIGAVAGELVGTEDPA